MNILEQFINSIKLKKSCKSPSPSHSPKDPPSSDSSFVSDGEGNEDSVMLTVWSKSKPKFELQFPYTVSSIKFPDIWIIGEYLVSELFLLLKCMTELSAYFCVITFLPLLLCKGNNNLKILNHQNKTLTSLWRIKC